MEEIYLKIFNENACIFKPNENKKKNGIILLGDEEAFVTEQTTDIHKNKFRYNLIQKLTKEGYYVTYSNNYNKNYGSFKACNNIVNLHYSMTEDLLLKESVHLIGIGLGSFLGLKLSILNYFPIRSLTFVKPILDIYKHRVHIFEKERYDKIGEEMNVIYSKNDIDFFETYHSTLKNKNVKTPTQIFYAECDEHTPMKNNLHLEKHFINTSKNIIKDANHLEEEKILSEDNILKITKFLEKNN